MIAAALVAVTCVMLAAGTVVTGTGPLAGDADTPRYGLPLEGVTQLHADIGWLLTGLSVALVVGLRFSGAPQQAVRAGWIVIAAIGTQGVIGYIQYFNHLPAGLVWVHVQPAPSWSGSPSCACSSLLRERDHGKYCANSARGDRTQQAAGAAGPIGSCREHTGQS